MNPSKNEALAKSRLSIVGLVLAILLPPIGLIISVVALNQIRKRHLGGRGRAIFGTVWGAIFTLLILLGAWLITGIVNNPAKNDMQPLATRIQAAGGQKLCDDGDSGEGGDNTQPWYEAYYETLDSSNLTSQVEQYAAQSGYTLTPDTGLITELKNVAAGANVTDTLPPNEPAYSAKNDYLTANKTNGGELSVTVYRNTSVPLNCGVANYGKLRSTGNNSAIIDMQLTLPSRD